MKTLFTSIFLMLTVSIYAQNTPADSIKEPEAIPVRVIEQVPIFKGCENSPNKNYCLNNKIRRFIGKHFNADDAKCEEFKMKYDRKLKRKVKKCKKEVAVTGRVIIKTTFVIDTLGYTTDIKALSPYPTMNKEAIRVLKKLPKFIPGFQRGRKVRVRYGLPITFNLL